MGTLLAGKTTLWVPFAFVLHFFGIIGPFDTSGSLIPLLVPIYIAMGVFGDEVGAVQEELGILVDGCQDPNFQEEEKMLENRPEDSLGLLV